MMKPRLSENPREWRKFGGGLSAVLALLGLLALRRHAAAAPWFAAAGCLAAAALFLPKVVRPLYCVGMTAGAWIGKWLGAALLFVVFSAAVAPLGWLLRRMGKDLLDAKPRPDAASYWLEKKRRSDLRQQF